MGIGVSTTWFCAKSLQSFQANIKSMLVLGSQEALDTLIFVDESTLKALCCSVLPAGARLGFFYHFLVLGYVLERLFLG